MLEINQYINNDFKPFDVGESITYIQIFFSDLTFSHFPIIQDNIYIGCIAADDVVTFDKNKTPGDYKYTLEGFFVRKNMVWLDVLEIFAKNHSNMVPVLDENNLYCGYYELNDIIQFFHETPFMKEDGNILTIEKSVNDYAMSQISQIVESNNGKILGMFISEISTDIIRITIKITPGNMNEVIQTFRRYDYNIISEHHEDSYLNNLKERSEYLHKFLNI